MGATDSQIGLIQLVPNLAACLLLLPLGRLSERMRSSRTMLLILLSMLGLGYMGHAAVSLTGASGVPLMYITLALTVGVIALYGGQWQTFFGDVIPLENRSSTYGRRNQAMYALSIVTPLLCGTLMNLQQDTAGKLHILRIFYLTAAAASWLQVAVLLRMPACPREIDIKPEPLRQAIPSVLKAVTEKEFLWFLVPFLLFYLSWHIDWSMWYLAQVNYLYLNESQLSIYSAFYNIGQLVAVGILAGVCRRKSPDYAVIIGAVGLVTCPISMLIALQLPKGIAFWFFTFALSVFNSAECVVPMSAVQILLRLSPRRNRALIANLYTLLITLSNSLMPWAGVRIYLALGGDRRALQLFMLIEFLMRSCGTLLLIVRWRRIQKRSLLSK